MCSFLVKGKLHVGAGLPRHTSAFSFSTMILFLEVPKHQNSSKQKSYRRPRSLSENHEKSRQSFREEEGEENIWLPLINNLRQPKNICTNTHTNRKISYSEMLKRFSDLLGAQVEDKSLHSLQACLRLEEALWEAFLGKAAFLLGEQLGCGFWSFLGLRCPHCPLPSHC